MEKDEVFMIMINKDRVATKYITVQLTAQTLYSCNYKYMIDVESHYNARDKLLRSTSAKD